MRIESLEWIINQFMKNLLHLKIPAVVLSLYVIALHSSIAGMEILGWTAVLLAVVLAFATQSRPQIDRITAGWLVLVLLVILSELFTTPELRNWANAGFMRWVILAIALRYLLERALMRPGWLEIGARIWFFVLIVIGIYATVQGFTGLDLVRVKQGTPLNGMYYAKGFFNISITFASTAGMSMAMALGWLLSGPGKDRKWSAAAVVFGILAVLFSLSRATLGAVGVVVVLGLILTRPKLVLPALAGLAAAAAIAISQLTAVRTRMATFMDLGHDRSTGMRLDLWRGYWAAFADHPWLGVGLFNPVKLLPHYYEQLGVTQPFYSHAHSNYMQWLAGAGLFSLLLYLAVSAGMLWISFQLFRQARDASFRALGLGTFLAQVILHIDGLIECNFFDGEINHMVVFVWALALAGLYCQTQFPKVAKT